MSAKFAAVAPINFTINNTFTTALTITDAEQGYIAVSYTNPSNNPFTANNLYMFLAQQSSTQLPSTPAIASATAPSSGGTVISPTGGNTFGAIPYLITYSVAAAVTASGTTTYQDLCATAWIPGVPIADPTQIQYFQPSLGINVVQPQLVSFQYNLPQGFDPSQGSWIGLWRGHVNPYAGSPWNAAPITLVGQSSGSSPLMVNPQSPIANGAPYTAALFTSGWTTNPANLPKANIACYITFTTGAKVGDKT
ncbi:MAG: hypothetical protein ABR975_15175 [Vulcanimicrobiaceae bacterium]